MRQEFKEALKFNPRLQLVTKRYELKNKEWILKESHLENVESKYFYNVYNSISFFESLGGTEDFEWKTDGATSISVSPDKKNKTVREFYLVD